MKRVSRSDQDDCDWKTVAAVVITAVLYLGFLLWAFVYPFYTLYVNYVHVTPYP